MRLGCGGRRVRRLRCLESQCAQPGWRVVCHRHPKVALSYLRTRSEYGHRRTRIPRSLPKVCGRSVWRAGALLSSTTALCYHSMRLGCGGRRVRRLRCLESQCAQPGMASCLLSASQSRAELSYEAVRTRLLSGENTALVTRSACPASVPSAFPSALHSRAVLSCDAVSTRRPLGEKTALLRESVWPTRMAISLLNCQAARSASSASGT